VTTALDTVMPVGNIAQAAEINEIIVTARKREESLQEVPLAITAFDADAIEETGIRSLEDIAALTPGLNFFNPVGGFLPVPVIRGVAPTNIFGENNAAIFVDGVYVSGREGLNFSELDLERIEVNKGPQAALYGRTAFSGAINFVSAKPTDEFGVKTEVKAGNDGIMLVKGVVSGPIAGDMLKGRLAVAYDEWDGSYDNPLSSVDVGGHEYRTFQGSLLFDPLDNLSILATGYFSDDEIADAATTSLAANCENSNFADVPANPPRLENYCGKVPSLNGNNIAKIGSATGEEREITRLSLKIDWEISAGTFTAVTGYSDTEQKSRTDGNRDLGESLPFVYCNQAVNFPFPGTCRGFQRFTTGLLQNAPNPDTTEEISQEFRWSSEVGRLKYDVGFYYFDVEAKSRELGVQATQPLPADFVGFGPFVTIIPNVSYIPIGDGAFAEWFQPGGDIGGGLATKEETDSWSFFGAMDYAFTEAVTGRFELRYANETKEQDELSLKDDWDLWAWRTSLDKDIGDNWTVYGSIAHAEKPGEFDVDTVDVTTDPGPPPVSEERLIVNKVDPEENTTFEIGAKGTAFGRVFVTAALYYIDWSDIVLPQVLSSDPGSGLPFEQPESFLLNSGSADIWGFEVEASTDITDNLRGSIGFSYADSELEDAATEAFADWPSFSPDGDVTGNELLRQPKVMANASLAYKRAFIRDWDFYGRTDINYQDQVYNGNDNQGYYPSHTYVNLTLGLENDSWAVEFWARNLFDNDEPVGGYRDVYFNNTSDISQSLPAASAAAADFFPFRYSVSHPDLRTYGVAVRWKFGALQ
jgi:iron complex outermembrane receptor protein